MQGQIPIPVCRDVRAANASAPWARSGLSLGRFAKEEGFSPDLLHSWSQLELGSGGEAAGCPQQWSAAAELARHTGTSGGAKGTEDSLELPEVRARAGAGRL